VGAGGAASGEVVLTGGSEIVLSSGVTTSTTISSGVFQQVLAGGVASSTVVMAGAEQVVAAGAIASNTQVSGGAVDASGQIVGMQLTNGGQVQLHSGGSATGVVVSGGAF